MKAGRMVQSLEQNAPLHSLKITSEKDGKSDVTKREDGWYEISV
ncbi:hypothetical protein SP19_182 [Salmonella phage 19]|nr:hypothetical protein SP19_182 [Salmonella phage 19]